MGDVDVSLVELNDSRSHETGWLQLNGCFDNTEKLILKVTGMSRCRMNPVIGYIL